jgi:dihydrofolate reductase
MKNIILYFAFSLDGFIARGDRSVDWLFSNDYQENKIENKKKSDIFHQVLKGARNDSA